MRHSDPDRHPAGFSLIELTIVLGAIAAMLAVITLGTGAINSSRLSTMERDIRTLHSAATAWAAQQASPTYGGVSVTALRTAGILPPNGSGTNPWGTPYTVSGTVTSFTVASDANSGTNCATLAARLSPAAASASCVGSSLTVTF